MLRTISLHYEVIVLDALPHTFPAAWPFYGTLAEELGSESLR